jgi:hypothetical protein
MTAYAPTPTGSTAADLLAWWRLRARAHRAAAGYYLTCRTALAQLGTETELRRVNALTLDPDRLADAAAATCWADLPAPSRHHHRLQLRRAVTLFNAAVDQHGTGPAAPARHASDGIVPGLVDNAGEYDDQSNTPALIAYLAADPDVAALARALLNTADRVAAEASPQNLTNLADAVAVLGAAVADAGVPADRVPPVTAALTAHIHRFGDNPR